MPVFQDSENVAPLVPQGDYTLTVEKFEIGISKGGKTAGAETYKLELTVDGHGTRVYENLIDAPQTFWKIDTFLKSAGVRHLKKGQAFSFRKDEAERNGWQWVNPIGLRVHARLVQEQLPAKDGRPPKTVNKVAAFYTDREVLPPRRVETPEEEKPF